jgi:hypothetical protein
MKPTIKFLILTLAVLAVSQISCKQEETPSIPEVQFNIDNPSQGNQYHKGDTIFISGLLTWENFLHGYELTLKNETTDSVVFTQHSHMDGYNIHLHSFWINDVDSMCDMALIIEALTDHEGAKETKVIRFHCHSM